MCTLGTVAKQSTVACWLLLWAMSAAGAELEAGRVTYLRGEATLRHAASSRPMAVGTTVQAGDRIVTGKDSRAVVTLTDGTTITLGDDTDFGFKAYEYSTATHEGKAALELLKGVFRAVTGLLGKQAHPDLTVTTVVATLGVRGTDFWGGFHFSDALDVAVFAGRGIFVENAAGRVEITEPGFGTTVRSAHTPPDPPKKWGRAKIDEAERAVALAERRTPKVETPNAFEY
jgi:hypothetical protein